MSPMVCSVLLVTVLALGGYLPAAEPAVKTYYDWKLLRFNLDNERQVTIINDWINGRFEHSVLLTPANINTGVNAIISPEAKNDFLSLLEMLKIKVEILNENVGEHLDSVAAENNRLREKEIFHPFGSNDFVSRFLNFSDIQTFLQTLDSTYTNIFEIGKSYEKRPISVLKIKTGFTDKQIIFIDSGLHAREWLAPASHIYVIQKLLHNLNNDDVKLILDKYEIHSLVIANPDGYEFSHSTDRFWRKNRHYLNSECIGVDLNRNFDAFFGTTGVERNCSSTIYPGAHAFSELESRILADYILKISKRTKLYLTLHTFGQYWFIPYGFQKGRKSPNFEDMDKVAKLGVKAIHEKYNTEWEVGSAADLLYESSGGSDDWVKLKTSIKYAYCLELRPSEPKTLDSFAPSANEIEPSGEELFAALLSMAKNMT